MSSTGELRSRKELVTMLMDLSDKNEKHLKQIKNLEAKNTALEQQAGELPELLEDRARLDFLEEHRFSVLTATADDFVGEQKRLLWIAESEDGQSNISKVRTTARQAIDAARKEGV